MSTVFLCVSWYTYSVYLYIYLAARDQWKINVTVTLQVYLGSWRGGFAFAFICLYSPFCSRVFMTVGWFLIVRSFVRWFPSSPHKKTFRQLNIFIADFFLSLQESHRKCWHARKYESAGSLPRALEMLFPTHYSTDHSASEGVDRSSRPCVIWRLSLLCFDSVYKAVFIPEWITVSEHRQSAISQPIPQTMMDACTMFFLAWGCVI
jgi:hypothetical protein